MLWTNIKNLTQLNGVSGNETAVEKYITDYIKNYVSYITVDTMGNIIAFKKGTGNTKHKVMISSHMDEVGFIVCDITSDGFIKFKEVGGIDTRILLAQRVHIGENKVDGVIGIKAVHLRTKSERGTVVQLKDMYIDIGASSKEDALKYVKKGDYIAFNSKYRELGSEKEPVIKAKALDDRIGCALMLELISKEYESDIYFCFNVQEEVGLRGAAVMSRRVNADVAIVLESTTAADVPFTKEHEKATHQGKGAVISIMDRASYADKGLNKFVCNTANANNINYQFKQTTFGGNDAGAIQSSGNAVRVCAISMPCRYIHSPVSTVKKSDISDGFDLAYAVLKNINDFVED